MTLIAETFIYFILNKVQNDKQLVDTIDSHFKEFGDYISKNDAREMYLVSEFAREYFALIKPLNYKFSLN